MLVVFWYFLRERKKKGGEKKNKKTNKNHLQHPNPGWQNQILSKPSTVLARKKRQCECSAEFNHELICQLFQVKTGSAAIIPSAKNLDGFPWISYWLWLKGGAFFALSFDFNLQGRFTDAILQLYDSWKYFFSWNLKKKKKKSTFKKCFH